MATNTPINSGYLLNPLDARSNAIIHMVNQSTSGSSPGVGDLPIRAGQNITITFSNGGYMYMSTSVTNAGGGIPTNGTPNTVVVYGPDGRALGTNGLSIAYMSNVLVMMYSNWLNFNYLTEQMQLDYQHEAATNNGVETFNMDFTTGNSFQYGTETIGPSGSLDLTQLPGLGVLTINVSKVVQETAFNGSNNLALSGANTWVPLSGGGSYVGTSGGSVTNLGLFGSATNNGNEIIKSNLSVWGTNFDNTTVVTNLLAANATVTNLNIVVGGVIGSVPATFFWGANSPLGTSFSLDQNGDITETGTAFIDALTVTGNLSIDGSWLGGGGLDGDDGSGNIFAVSLSLTGGGLTTSKIRSSFLVSSNINGGSARFYITTNGLGDGLTPQTPCTWAYANQHGSTKDQGLFCDGEIFTNGGSGNFQFTNQMAWGSYVSSNGNTSPPILASTNYQLPIIQLTNGGTLSGISVQGIGSGFTNNYFTLYNGTMGNGGYISAGVGIYFCASQGESITNAGVSGCALSNVTAGIIFFPTNSTASVPSFVNPFVSNTVIIEGQIFGIYMQEAHQIYNTIINPTVSGCTISYINALTNRNGCQAVGLVNNVGGKEVYNHISQIGLFDTDDYQFTGGPSAFDWGADIGTTECCSNEVSWIYPVHNYVTGAYEYDGLGFDPDIKSSGIFIHDNEAHWVGGPSYIMYQAGASNTFLRNECDHGNWSESDEGFNADFVVCSLTATNALLESNYEVVGFPNVYPFYFTTNIDIGAGAQGGGPGPVGIANSFSAMNYEALNISSYCDMTKWSNNIYWAQNGFAPQFFYTDNTDAQAVYNGLTAYINKTHELTATNANPISVMGAVPQSQLGTTNNYQVFAGVSWCENPTNFSIFGASAGNTTGTGTYNIGLGNNSLSSETTSSQNIAIGQSAGSLTTSGNGNNVFIGFNAGMSNTTGSFNAYINTVGVYGNESFTMRLGNPVNQGSCFIAGQMTFPFYTSTGIALLSSAGTVSDFAFDGTNTDFLTGAGTWSGKIQGSNVVFNTLGSGAGNTPTPNMAFGAVGTVSTNSQSGNFTFGAPLNVNTAYIGAFSSCLLNVTNTSGSPITATGSTKWLTNAVPVGGWAITNDATFTVSVFYGLYTNVLYLPIN